MLTMKLTLKNQDVIKRFTERKPWLIEDAVKKSAAYGKGIIMLDTPKKTGNTRRQWRLVRISASVYQIINETFHIGFLEWGTGLFGPRHKLIKPVTTQNLHFPIIKGNSIKAWARTKAVKGFPPFKTKQK